MPLRKGSSKKVVSQNISEFHTGKTYAHTQAKFGKAKADKQAIAVALNEARKYSKKAKGGKADKEEKIPLPKPRPFDWDHPAERWLNLRASDNIEDRRDENPKNPYPPNIPSLDDDINFEDNYQSDSSALSDALGGESLEAQRYPNPTFDQRFVGQRAPSSPVSQSDSLFLGLKHLGQDRIFDQQHPDFADGGSIEDEEAKENLGAQGYIPAADQAPQKPTDLGGGLRRWWYGDQPTAPQGELPEADLTQDPVSRGLSNIGAAFTAPGRALKGELQLGQMIPEALNMAAVATGATSTSPVEGGLGTGVGKLSEGPHLAKLTQMERMEQLGMNPKAIYQQTGWYRGDDGMPRFWISDANAKLKSENIPTWDGKPFIDEDTTLGHIWDHPDLYKAYPWLKDVEIRSKGHDPNALAHYDPMSEAIYLGPADDLSDMHDRLHHEIIHAIQHHEGFANGGNLSMFLPQDFGPRMNAWNQRVTDFYSKLRQRGLSFPKQIGADDLQHITTSKIENLSREDNMIRADLRQNGLLGDAHKIAREGTQLQKLRTRAYENYLHLAGESEARDAPFLRENPQALKPGEIPLHKNPGLLPNRAIEPGKPMPFQRSSAYGGNQELPEDFVPEGVYEPNPYEDEHQRGGKVKKKHKQIDEDPQEHEFVDFKRGGLIDSDIPGRTDKIPMKLRPGSYVLPADIPSALGQGNSKAGAEILKKMFTHSAYGLPPPHIHSHEFRAPRFITHFAHHKAKGGKTDDEARIIAAGGEFIVHPDVVKAIGHGDMKTGHKLLDKFVLHTRKEHIKTLKGLKPPK